MLEAFEEDELLKRPGVSAPGEPESMEEAGAIGLTTALDEAVALDDADTPEDEVEFVRRGVLSEAEATPGAETLRETGTFSGTGAPEDDEALGEDELVKMGVLSEAEAAEGAGAASGAETL